MEREIKFEYGFESVNGIVKKVYYLHEIPDIKQKCDVWDVLPIKYVREYTGLKDKKGVDVYEGDYIKWTNGNHYWEAIIQTVLNNKSNTLYAIETYHNCTSNEDDTLYTFERSDSRKGCRNDIEYLSNEIEVIGNVYETPELLK